MMHRVQQMSALLTGGPKHQRAEFRVERLAFVVSKDVNSNVVVGMKCDMTVTAGPVWVIC